jgi:hypothetical protein
VSDTTTTEKLTVTKVSRALWVVGSMLRVDACCGTPAASAIYTSWTLAAHVAAHSIQQRKAAAAGVPSAKAYVIVLWGACLQAGVTTLINRTYIVIKHLGSGTYGQVKLAFNLRDRKLYAIKLCRKSQYGSGGAAGGSVFTSPR